MKKNKPEPSSRPWVTQVHTNLSTKATDQETAASVASELTGIEQRPVPSVSGVPGEWLVWLNKKQERKLVREGELEVFRQVGRHTEFDGPHLYVDFTYSFLQQAITPAQCDRVWEELGCAGLMREADKQMVQELGGTVEQLVVLLTEHWRMNRRRVLKAVKKVLKAAATDTQVG